MNSILHKRDMLVQRLMKALYHLSKERQYAIITSFISLTELERIVKFQERTDSLTHIGFTGTQEGMTQKQLVELLRLLREDSPLFDNGVTFHHGDCIGADAQFHSLIRKYSPESKIHGHPPSDPRKRAFCKFDTMSEPKPYLVRNHDIVDASAVLIAAPKTNTMELRSGTWATVRYAKKVGANTIILYPKE